MTDGKTNNPIKPIPEKGQIGKQAGGEENLSELSRDELKEKILAEEKLKAEKPKEPPKEEPKKEPEEIVEDEFKGKTKKELIKMYHGIQDLQRKQTDEIGELRKFRKDTEELNEKLKDIRVSSTKNFIIQQNWKKMTKEERDKFLEDLGDKPDETLYNFISKTMSPFLNIQANNKNSMAIEALKKEKKDKIVPYNEDEINKILNSYTDKNGRNSMFDKHGSGAFREAYNIYRDEHFDEFAEKKEKERIEKAEQKLDEEKKKRAFTEPQSPSAKDGKKPTNYEDMSYEELKKKVGKTDD